MSVIEVNNSNFNEVVLNSASPVLVDFNAAWCGPCRMLRPILDDIAAQNPSYKIASVNIDDEPDLAQDYEISAIPCLLVFRGGQEVNRSVGLIPKEAVLNLLEG